MEARLAVSGRAKNASQKIPKWRTRGQGKGQEEGKQV